MTGTLRSHKITLRSGAVTLRPMTESDWRLVTGWWNDPDIAYYADAADRSYTLAQIQEIVSRISKSAYCFIIEYEGRPIGECWLQEMNLDRVLEVERGLDCRRIDLEIEKAYWGRGIGTATIKLLVDFGLGPEDADAIFGMDVDDYNIGSRRAFEKAGFSEHSSGIQLVEGREQAYYDYVIRRSEIT